jgi:hypothetical protein
VRVIEMRRRRDGVWERVAERPRATRRRFVMMDEAGPLGDVYAAIQDQVMAAALRELDAAFRAVDVDYELNRRRRRE